MGGGTPHQRPTARVRRLGCRYQSDGRVDRPGGDRAPRPSRLRDAWRPLLRAFGAGTRQAPTVRIAPVTATDVPVKYFLWVKEIDCAACGKGFVSSPATSSPKMLATRSTSSSATRCGELNETLPAPDDRRLLLAGHASATGRQGGRCACPHCAHDNRPTRARPKGPPRHRLFAIEYYNPARKDGTKAGSSRSRTTRIWPRSRRRTLRGHDGPRIHAGSADPARR